MLRKANSAQHGSERGTSMLLFLSDNSVLSDLAQDLAELGQWQTTRSVFREDITPPQLDKLALEPV